MMKIDFYYYSIQCPLNETMMQLLNKYKDKLEIHFHDISQESALVKELGMFYPTLTILNGQRRYYSPLRSSFLEQAASGIYPDELPYLPKLSSNAVTKQIVPLTNENIRLACAVDSLRTLPVQRKKGSCAHADKKSMGSFIQMKEGTFLGVPSTFRQCLFHMISRIARMRHLSPAYISRMPSTITNQLR